MTESNENQRQLNGQVAVVTGAARGIGAAVAQHLARLGAHVVLTARDQKLLQEVSETIKGDGGAASIAPCDLQEDQAIRALARTVSDQAGRCDILVNCAGVGVIGRPLHEFVPEDWDRTMSVNLRAPTC